jgi:hypothetical protein
MSEHDCTTPAPPNELTAEYLRSVLNYDPETGIFTWRVSPKFSGVRAGDRAGCPDGIGYLQIGVQGKVYRAHRLAWLYVYGYWPNDQIDHVNRDRADNRIANLRAATSHQNALNMGKACNNTSGHTGVVWHKNVSKWGARIKHNQKSIYLGLFENLEEAVAARKAGELKYWGVNRAD